jgi:GT2 family glycosyltransferase
MSNELLRAGACAEGCPAMQLLPSYGYQISIIVVSFNTRDLLRQCLESLLAECALLPNSADAEILVVDNSSRDGSAEMVTREFSSSPIPVRLIRSDVNLGFGVANNLAAEAAQGRYLVLLNSDAFFHPGALRLAWEHMNADPAIGIGGARLVSREGAAQPSARCFHSIWRDALVLSGLSTRFPRSRIFGAPDRTWADPNLPAEVDWVPGAFSILRREALAKAGLFDPAFFLYYEEVDLCRRVKAAGFRVLYWPDVVVTHLAGESSRQLSSEQSRSLKFSETAAQVVLWRMRSTLLYYRKHHGAQARLALWLEESLYNLRRLRNRCSSDPARRERAQEAVLLLRLMRQAWRETDGGRVSPPRPW